MRFNLKNYFFNTKYFPICTLFNAVGKSSIIGKMKVFQDSENLKKVNWQNKGETAEEWLSVSVAIQYYR